MKPLKALFVLSGFIFLALGIGGILLPLLPATPFLLAASFCFLRGSEGFYRLFMANPHIGPRIRRFKERGLSLREKLSIYLVVLAMLLPVIITSPVIHLRITLVALLLVKALVFARMKTAKPEGGGKDLSAHLCRKGEKPA
ncbi:MAG: YbaN family protein [Treponema sp.]|jgi:uncharacterized membrane protein YbaN (DUF454 family)|nr:YbaN family protein [Treponema sp.]